MPRRLHSNVIHLLGLAGILVLAAVLRLLYLTRESAWLDEIFSINFVSTRMLLAVITDSFHVDYHPFSYYALLDLWTSILGYDDFVCRLLSVVLGVGGVVAVYLLTKTVFRSEWAALLSALLMAISPTHIAFSQEVRMYILMMLVWPIFLRTLYNSWGSNFTLRSSLSLILSFLVFVYAHGASGLFAVPLLTCFIFAFVVHALRAGCTAHAIRGVVACSVAIGLYLPWLVRLFYLHGETPKKLGVFRVEESLNFFKWLMFYKDVISTAQVLCILIGMAAVTVLMFRWRPLRERVIIPMIPLLVSIVIVIVLQFLLDILRPSYQGRNLVFLLPPCIACFSFFAVQTISLSSERTVVRFSRSLAMVSMIIIVVAVSLKMGQVSVHHAKYGYGKEQWKEAVREIGPKIISGDVIAFYAGFMQQCWDHYAVGYGATAKPATAITVSHKKFGIPRTTDESAFKARVMKVIEAVDTMKDPRNSLWVFYSHVQDPERLHAVLEAAHLTAVGEGRLNGILMGRYVNLGVPDQ